MTLGPSGRYSAGTLLVEQPEPSMRAVDIIRKKRDGLALDSAEIESFVQGATMGAWPDYQISALLMAIVLRGMSAEETATLTGAMVRSGARLNWSDLPGPKVDKHSTGGVGDKTSLIVVPLAAACGCLVPKMSGRGLGHTGGTLDKLESIPNYRVSLSLAELRYALQTVGCALAGQTAEIAPADKVLYALRDVTATVESIPLIAASIMSKKIAEGIDALVLDVKCGRGAFMKSRTDARKLAQALVEIGNASGVRTRALITAMDEQLGHMVGNSLEVIECLETLKGRGPADLEMLAIELASQMVELSGIAANMTEARAKVRTALTSGKALGKLREIIAFQRGNTNVVDHYHYLPSAPSRIVYQADRSGYLNHADAELIGRATMVLGAGRNRVEEPIDHAVGAVVLVKRGSEVRAGDPLVELHYRESTHLAAARTLIREACRIEEMPTPLEPLILETIG